MTSLSDLILQWREVPVERLALQLAGRTDLDVPFVLKQVEGWQRLRTKVPSWAAIDALEYPHRLALEQCSGEPAARHKAQVVSRLIQATGHCDSMVDLTGGLGVDFSFVSPLFRRSVYVERQEALCQTARHNFPLLGLNHVDIVCDDGVEHLHRMQPVDLIFLDPARRNSAGRKTVLIEDCEPDVCQLQELLLEKAETVILKLSTMLDIAGAVHALHHVSDVHVVAVGGECKDLLVVMRRGWESAPLMHAVEGTAELCFTPEEEASAPCEWAEQTGRYLYEPGPAILKAGAFRLVAHRYALRKLHPNSHLYTSDQLHEDFPGRIFEVKATYGFGKRDLKELKAHVQQANLTVRNFPSSVDALRKKLKLREGGTAYLFATTMGSNDHLLIECTKPQ